MHGKWEFNIAVIGCRDDLYSSLFFINGDGVMVHSEGKKHAYVEEGVGWAGDFGDLDDSMLMYRNQIILLLLHLLYYQFYTIQNRNPSSRS